MELRSLLQDLDRALPTAARERFAEGAAESAIDSLEQRLGFGLAPDHRELLRWHNGGVVASGETATKRADVFPDFTLFGCEEVQRNAVHSGLEAWRDVAAVGLNAPSALYMAASTRVNASLVLIDPEIYWREPYWAQIFDSVEAMVGSVVEVIRDGIIAFTPEGLPVVGGRFYDIVRRANPGSDYWIGRNGC